LKHPVAWKMKNSGVVLLIALTFFASSVVAEAAGRFYAGINTGNSGVSNFCEDATGDCSDTDRGWTLYGGNQITGRFGLEVAYTRLGKLTQVISFQNTRKTEIDGFGVSAVGTLPVLEEVEFFGKLGLFLAHIAISGAGVFLDGDSVEVTYGLGAKLNLTKPVHIRLEWDRFPNVGNPNKTGEEDIDFLSAGVGIRF